MLSVAIANATVQHLVKEEGDVATRVQRRILPEEFSGGFILDIPRRLKQFMESFESHAFSPTVGRQVFPPYSQPSHRESIVSSGTAAGCWFSMSTSWLTQDVVHFYFLLLKKVASRGQRRAAGSVFPPPSTSCHEWPQSAVGRRIHVSLKRDYLMTLKQTNKRDKNWVFLWLVIARIAVATLRDLLFSHRGRELHPSSRPLATPSRCN